MRPVMMATSAMCIGAAIVGLTLGQNMSKLSEAEVITHFAEQYAAKTGNPVSDCSAFPHPDAKIWMVVQCGQEPTQTQYFVAPNGALVSPVVSLPET